MSVHIAFLIRFSYVGYSGWRSAEAQDPSKLLDPERLARRMSLFRHITVPSLAAQTDPNFHVFVLTAKGMPDKYKIRLRRLLTSRLGPDRCHILFRQPGRAAAHLKKAIKATFAPDDHVAQVVLDDDDAISKDFVHQLRQDCENISTDLTDPSDYRYVTYPKGLSMVMRAGSPQLYHRNQLCTNLGLTLLARSGFPKTPFCFAHKKIISRHPTHIVDTPGPWYVRTVHAHNDSQAHFAPAVLNAQEHENAKTRFPFLVSRRQALANLSADDAPIGTEHPLEPRSTNALTSAALSPRNPPLGKTPTIRKSRIHKPNQT